MAALAIVAAALAGVLLLAPETASLVGLATLYLNLPAIAISKHGVPSLAAGAAILLLLAPFVIRLLRREPIVIDRTQIFLFAFFGAVLLSTFAVQDVPDALSWLQTFVTEGLLLYVAVVNLFRTPDRLRRAIDVVLVCGAILGTLTLVQEATHSYERTFGGLAQRNLEFEVRDAAAAKDPFASADEIRVSNRAGGPIGEPNRYAQILLVLLPLAFMRAKSATRRMTALLACAAGAFILAGVLLTYSRGAFVTLLVLVAILVATRTLRIRYVAAGALAMFLAVLAFAPGYVLRMGTLQDMPGLLHGTRESNSDQVMRSRLTETLAAWTVFTDHPIVGVGPGQYAPVYSEKYMRDPDIAYKWIDRPRRAHNLYFELAAETGILGVGTFLALVGLVQIRLWRAFRRWRHEREDLANLALRFFVSITGYLVSGVFLHLSYQRYYGLLLGLAAAALQVLAGEEMRTVRIRHAFENLRATAEPAR
jgi:putative inorganic carbon (HCO3(-)) transporter